MKNEIHLTIGIWRFKDITHQEITDSLGLQPKKILIEGEKTNPKFLTIAKENGWMYTHSKDVTKPFEEQMNELLTVLRERSDALKKLSGKYYCELSCAIFKKDEDESMPWVHLTRNHIRFLNDFNIEFDLDLYA